MSAWEFWGFAALAIAIAIIFSSVELLTRYRSRSFREIFISRYYAWFAILNAAFSFLTYWALPYITSVTVKPEFSAAVSQGLMRAVSAGFGYLVIARTSILDITTREKTTYGVGFDVIYRAFSEYLLEHHQRQMRKRMHADFSHVFQPNSGYEREVFMGTATLIRAGLASPEEKTAFDDQLNLANSDFTETGQLPEFCFRVYQLIRDFTAGVDEAKTRIAEKRQALVA